MTRDELIEAMARAICCPNADCAQDKPRDGYVTAIPCSRIIHMEAATAALSAIEASGGHVVFMDVAGPQERLGAEFESVWDANVDQLYATEASPFRGKP